MSIIKSNMTAPPPSGGALSSISEMNSLRFDGSSELTRTGMTGSSDWTMSLWFKLSKTSGFMRFIRMGFSPNFYISMNGEGASADVGKIQITGSTPSTSNVMSTALFRDTNAWYHMVANKTGVFVNGERIITLSSNLSTVGDGSGGNNGKWHIGQNGANGNGYFNGYMADIHYIDGQALDASHFGEEISGVWVPKAYDPATSGAYGTNGFHLDFADSGNIGNDVSGRGNHWTVN